MEENKKSFTQKVKECFEKNKKTFLWVGVGALTTAVTATVAYLGLKGHYTEIQPLPPVTEQETETETLAE